MRLLRESAFAGLCMLRLDANTVGSIAAVASIDWGCAIQVMAAASIGSNETFEATAAQTLYGLGIYQISIVALTLPIQRRLRCDNFVTCCDMLLWNSPSRTPSDRLCYPECLVRSGPLYSITLTLFTHI